MENTKILKGRISHFDPIRKFGFIQSVTGGSLFYKSSSVKSKSVQAGDYVTFIQIPSSKHLGEFEAVNVTKAYQSQDNYLIVDRPSSHLHDELENILPSLAKLITCNDRQFLTEQVDYPDFIGYTTCVKVNAQDEIVYAVREGRTGYTKFVKNRKPEQTNCITMVLKKTNDFYTIITAYYGEKAEPEPYDIRATEASIIFWDGHALIYGTEKIDPNTVTTICPWKNFT